LGVDKKILVMISVPPQNVRDKHIIVDYIIVEPIHQDFLDIRDVILDYDGLLFIEQIELKMRRFYLVDD
jgi:hypothetical protein